MTDELHLERPWDVLFVYEQATEEEAHEPTVDKGQNADERVREEHAQHLHRHEELTVCTVWVAALFFQAPINDCIEEHSRTIYARI